MKTQTFIVYWRDKDNNIINFERWGYKRLSTVIKKTISLMQYPIYERDNKNTVCIEFYATPDGYNKEALPRKVIPIAEAIKMYKEL